MSEQPKCTCLLTRTDHREGCEFATRKIFANSYEVRQVFLASSADSDPLAPKTERDELHKQIAAILNNRDRYDFDEAQKAVARLVADRVEGEARKAWVCRCGFEWLQHKGTVYETATSCPDCSAGSDSIRSINASEMKFPPTWLPTPEGEGAREALEETTGWAYVSAYTNERRWYYQEGGERPSHLWEPAKLLVARAALAPQAPAQCVCNNLDDPRSNVLCPVHGSQAPAQEKDS